MTFPAGPERRRRGLFVPALFTIVGLVLLIGLGVWQLERKAWKEGLVDQITRRMNTAPVPLPPPDRWSSLDAAHDEFTRVTFPAVFENDREALVFAGASAFRPDTSGPGYWVFTPARLADGARVAVNRGFVSEANKDPATRAAGLIKDSVDIIGVLRWPERAGIFTPAGEPARNLWFARDQIAIAAAKGWGNVAPFYVEQEAPAPPGGLPQPGKITVNLPNNHLQYAITWFGLAVVLAAVFISFVRSRRREPKAG
ncbi:MAG: SURF1 family protein [Bradyrhizobiaceae bacterium]|nr:SURF1 family protein [Hyphomicrobiales bacterium]MBV9427206.1 SURF1 family protein [Bradyrhizobiaceae bacterium]